MTARNVVVHGLPGDTGPRILEQAFPPPVPAVLGVSYKEFTLGIQRDRVAPCFYTHTDEAGVPHYSTSAALKTARNAGRQ